MCQAFAAEHRFVVELEQKYGRCENGHLRFSDRMCAEGRFCNSNREAFESKGIGMMVCWCGLRKTTADRYGLRWFCVNHPEEEEGEG